MQALRSFTMPSIVLAAALAVGTVGAGTATAAAGKPAPAPTGLSASASGNQDGSFDATTSWNAVANATSYRVAITMGGTTLASKTVTAVQWSPHFTGAPGNATLSVRAVIGKKPGRTATKGFVLPDVVAPNGSYSSSWTNSNGHATITQDSLTDNSPLSGVTRTVDWGDGTVVGWPTGTTINHTYPLTAMRYTPTVTLEDAATNSRVVDVPAIVIDDTSAPTGTFSNDTATAWAKWTKVTVSQSAINDDWTPANLIARTVDWKDGTTSTWTAGTTISHVYATAGSYAPEVTIADEAHNTTTYPLSSVVVSLDTVAPTVKLTLPRAKHSVKAWRTLRGKATDAQTGVKSVSVKAVEKRLGHWFGYNAKTHRWVKAATKAKAFAASKAVVVKTDSSNRWAAALRRLAKGTLAYRVVAVDHVGNHSVTVSHTATLTKR
jgi:hypothetical protein